MQTRWFSGHVTAPWKMRCIFSTDFFTHTSDRCATHFYFCKVQYINIVSSKYWHIFFDFDSGVILLSKSVGNSVVWQCFVGILVVVSFWLGKSVVKMINIDVDTLCSRSFHRCVEYMGKELPIHVTSIPIDPFVTAAWQCKHRQPTCCDLAVEARWRILRFRIWWNVSWCKLN